MAGKGKDTRPARSKQKDRSVRNKIKQMEEHLYHHPSDKFGQEKLERAKKGNSRAAAGCGPKPKEPEIGKKSQNHRDRRNKRK
jgi:hypothetical protein